MSVKLPDKSVGEMLCKVVELVGDDRLRVVCEDGEYRLARIPGKFRKKVWFKVGDYIIAVPWDFDPKKADVVYKYEKHELALLREHMSEVLDTLDKLI